MKSFYLILALFSGWFSLGFTKNSEPISDARWNYLIGEKVNAPYTVKPGDTLSLISQEQLGEIGYWPKLWEVNQKNLRNPHLLEPDQKLIFGRADGTISREPANQIMDSKASPKKAEEETTQDLREDYPSLHRLKFLFLDSEEPLGIITGSYENKNYLGSDSRVFVGPLIKDKLKVGNHYAVVREVKPSVLKKTAIEQISGKLVQIVGEIKIEGFGDDLLRAAIVSAYDGLERGDRIMDIPAITMKEPSVTPPSDLLLRILLGESLEQVWFNAGQLVVLDRGRSAGVLPGQIFKVFDDMDPILKDTRLVEPRSKGEVKIVHTSENSSVGYISKNRVGIEVGDVLISGDHLSDGETKLKSIREPVYLE
ncbi:MAG: LysM peptidoglycan-binding domain-containing protein [Pseudomonadota bacterium]